MVDLEKITLAELPTQVDPTLRITCNLPVICWRAFRHAVNCRDEEFAEEFEQVNQAVATPGAWMGLLFAFQCSLFRCPSMKGPLLSYEKTRHTHKAELQNIKALEAKLAAQPNPSNARDEILKVYADFDKPKALTRQGSCDKLAQKCAEIAKQNWEKASLY